MLRFTYSLLIVAMVLVSSCRTQKTIKDVEPVDTAGPVEVIMLVEPDAPITKEPAAPVPEAKSTVPVSSPVIPEAELAAITKAINAEDIHIAERIAKWKRNRDRGVWWECGERHTLDEFEGIALEWAQAVNHAYNNTSYKLRSGKVVKVNKAEAIGIMMRETRLDRCAVGPYPREFAYKNNIIQRRKGSLSHTMEEIKTIFTHRRFQGRLADIGPGQIVKRIGRGKEHIKWGTVKNFLSLDPGVQLVFDELADRGQMYSTRTPSNKWPGNGENTWYTNHVLRMGGKLTGTKQRRYRIGM